MHPALGDSGGVHAPALLLLKLRGALARLLPALWSGAPAAPEGCRLLIGQGRLLYADVLSPLVSTSLAIRAIHVVALLAPVTPVRPTKIAHSLGIRLDWDFDLGCIAHREGRTRYLYGFYGFTIRKRTYCKLSLKSPDLCEVCDHEIL